MSRLYIEIIQVKKTKKTRKKKSIVAEPVDPDDNWFEDFDGEDDF